MATDFTAVLLAGGRSTRMGRDKALLDWHGRPLIEHMLDRLQRAGAARVVVSGDRPGHAGVPDDVPGRGPVAGIASVLPHCADGPVVIVPVDVPLVAPERIARLCDALAGGRAAYFEGHPLPCGVRLDADIRSTTDALVDSMPAGPSVRAWLAACGAVPLDPGDAADLRPCNTPGQYAALAP